MSVEPMGELFWESGTQAMAQGPELMFFPGVPLHGKSPENSLSIGIIDSGISQAHPQLAGYIRACADFSGEGLDDRLGHGTLVALQLLYANGETNPSFAILSAKVTDAHGRIRQQAVIDAIDWMGQQRVPIVNMSLGFRGAADRHRELCAAIARNSNTLFIVAAGNFGPDVQVCPAACGLDNLLTVGATDASGQAAAYSGAGQVYAPGTARFQKVWSYYYEQGQALARAGQLPEARRAFEASLASQANAESEFQLGVLDLSAGKPKASISQFDKAIQLNPRFAEAHEMRGAALILLGDYKSAEDALRKSIALYPQDVTPTARRAGAHFNLALALKHLDRPEEAKAQLETVKALMPDYPRLDAALANLNRLPR